MMQRWSWLGWMMRGQCLVGNTMLAGFSVRRRGLVWFAVVRGWDVESLRSVVCFGRAERLYDALNNVTAAIRKGEWRPDKYARDGTHLAGPGHWGDE